MQTSEKTRITNLEKDLKAVISLLQEQTNERHINFATSSKTQTVNQTDLEVFQNFLNTVKCTFDTVSVFGKKMLSIHGTFADSSIKGQYTETMHKFNIDTFKIGNGMRFGGVTYYYAKEDIQDLLSWIKSTVLKP